MKTAWTCTAALIATLFAVSCDKPVREVRHYREIRFIADDAQIPVSAPAIATNTSRMPELPPDMRAPSLPLAWDTPAGWEDLGPSGMRITTLKVEGQECTLLSFPGDVGGDEANIRRWLGQINQSVPDEKLKELVSNPVRVTTRGGFTARLFDFADILPEDAPAGTLAAIIEVGDQTAFVKLSGDPAMLARQKKAFEQLCQSIRLRAEAP